MGSSRGASRNRLKIHGRYYIPKVLGDICAQEVNFDLVICWNTTLRNEMMVVVFLEDG